MNTVDSKPATSMDNTEDGNVDISKAIKREETLKEKIIDSFLQNAIIRDQHFHEDYDDLLVFY